MPGSRDLAILDLSEKGFTQVSIADKFNISQERVSAILKTLKTGLKPAHFPTNIRYRLSGGSLEAQRRYSRTEKGKEQRKRYQISDKGKSTQRRADIKRGRTRNAK